MQDINFVTITGNLGKDVEAKYSEDGAWETAKFNIATYCGAKNKNTGTYESKWWGVRLTSKVSTNPNYETPAAYAIANLKKGDRVQVSGKLSGWLQDKDLEARAQDPKHPLEPIMYIDADSVIKLEKPPKKETANTAQSSLPPF